MSGLTQKEEKAVMHYIEHGNKSDAYRHAYSTSRMKDKTINEKACLLFQKDKIKARVAELQAEMVDRLEITVESILDELEEARQLALNDDKGASAAVSASMGKARLCGLIVDKKEDVTPKRTKQEIDTRLVELLVRAIGGGDSEPAGRTGADRGEGETLPTVPGHGTA